MCGIAGTYLWPDGGPITDRLTAAVAHRGPDASGRYDHRAGPGEVHLGHRRLSIVDLSETGAQPMVIDGLALTYNGELYNSPELRTELQAAGVRFRGTSDTEVLLEAWRRWGTGQPAAGCAACSPSRCSTSAPASSCWPVTSFGIKPLFVRAAATAAWSSPRS